MNQDKNTRLFIIMLAAGLLLIGTMVFIQGQMLGKMQKSLSKIAGQLEGAEYGPPPNIEQNDCVLSGGEYKNGACECGRGYFLEAGQCMGQDGLTKKEVETIKTGEEKLMGDTDRGMPNPTLMIGDLTFEIPIEWHVVSRESTKVRIRVPDPKYNVSIAWTVNPVTSSARAADIRARDLNTNTLIATNSAGAKIYSDTCTPALFCGYIDYKGMLYAVTFDEPESNQRPPSDLDGIWFPRVNVTQEELIEVVKTVH